MSKTVFVTGGAGFIGSALVHAILDKKDWRVINIDKLTYSGNLASLEDIKNNRNHVFLHADISDIEAMRTAFDLYQPDMVMNLAAESHVDRSIDDPSSFIQTNIVGVFNLLEEARRYWKGQLNSNPQKAENFKFHHISTDEVFGDLTLNAAEKFSENTPYAPNSPYSASKASSDHLVRAWKRTYGLPTLISNCSNNYGPRQFPEKLMPLIIISALSGKPLPVYGKGNQIRDWLYVEDHVDALINIIEKGQSGATYAIGGNCEKKNIEVVQALCDVMDAIVPITNRKDIKSYHELITFVKDRPGHDERYAIDASKIRNELGWTPKENFKRGLVKTVNWYLNNKKWWQQILDGTYRCERLGTNI